MFGIGPGDWSSCQILTFVISMLKIHRGAERIENRKEDYPWECPFTEKGECRSTSLEPTGIKKEKYIPRLPENQRKLYQNFRLFFFHLYNNVAVIYQSLYM